MPAESFPVFLSIADKEVTLRKTILRTIYYNVINKGLGTVLSKPIIELSGSFRRCITRNFYLIHLVMRIAINLIHGIKNLPECNLIIENS